MSKKPIDLNTSFLNGINLTYKEFPIVKVLWVDAYTIGDAGWLERDKAMIAAKESLPYMITVGFLIYSDNLQVCIVNSIGPSETSQVNKIPRSMIVNMSTLHLV
jgi:hypothetical protein